MIITKPRGTQDYIYENEPLFDIVCDICKKIAKINGFYQIKTPIFESKNLFIRTIGDVSDIVNKEFYELTDKSNRQMVLRPELTASICRVVVEEKLLNKMSLPIKFFYIEPMFRYERPQSGRLRMFHQFGVEYIGANSYYYDADAILLALSILNELDVKDFTLKINNICSLTTRTKWIKALKQYFEPFKNQLTEDSKQRLLKNPLRILDDKIDGSKPFVKNAPKVTEFATKDEIEYFDNIKKVLDEMKVSYEIDQTLVRGLDYYCNFVFEIVSNSDVLKGQSTIIGGGRYNGMTKELGGEDSNCVGFAIGIERLLCLLKNNKKINLLVQKYKNVDVCVANLDESSQLLSFKIVKSIRDAGFSCLSNQNTTKLDKHFKYAKKQCAKFAVIIGKTNALNKTVTIKNQQTMKQEEISTSSLIDYLKQNIVK